MNGFDSSQRRSPGPRALLSAAAALSLLACKPQLDTTPPAGGDSGPVAASEQAEVVWPSEAFRAERPQPKEIKEVPIPSIETFELDNGLEVFLVQQQTLPTVMMFFEWDYGGVNDPRGRDGVASLCGDLMDEATKTKDKATFKAAQSDHGVELWVSAGDDRTSLGVRALKRELGPGLDLAVEMLLEPGMRPDDFERAVAQEKNWIKQMTASPQSIGYRLFASLVWGSGHPYGKIETEASVDKIKLADCQKWAAKLKPDGARLWVVGKVSQDELRSELGPRLGAWKGKAPKPIRARAAKPAAGTIFFVHVADAAQSQIIVGHPGPQRQADDYEATELMTAILGGSFSSRINMNLREDKGWAYGARGGFSYSRGGSMFMAASSVRSDATPDAVREILKEIAGMRAAPPTAEELDREQKGALLAMPANFATATRTLVQFRSLDYYDLPLDWHVGYQKRLRALDPAAVHAAAQAHLQPGDHVVLVVGDGKVVLEGLEAMAKEELIGSGGIQYLDADGNPMARPSFESDDSKPGKSG